MLQTGGGKPVYEDELVTIYLYPKQLQEAGSKYLQISNERYVSLLVKEMDPIYLIPPSEYYLPSSSIYVATSKCECIIFCVLHVKCKKTTSMGWRE